MTANTESVEIFSRFSKIISLPETGNRNAYVMEFGACDGYHTNLMCEILSRRGGPYSMHAFEPALHLVNSFVSQNSKHFPSLKFVPSAVGAVDAVVDFYRSFGSDETQFYSSSSIKEPSLVCDLYPVKFQKLSCECCRLDSYAKNNSIPYVDFIWSDIQGAEKDLILGGMETFSKTRYFFTEVSSSNLYLDTGYSTASDLISMLPGRWVLVEDYGGDVLLKNLDYPFPG